MLKYFIILFFSFLTFQSLGQVKLLTISELDQRFSNGKDTTYVVNFWATWCGPCVEELPVFEKLNESNIGKPLKIILVSLDFKSKLKSQVIPFVNKNNIKSEVFVANESNAFIEQIDKKWSGALPATLFVNKEKNISVFYEKSFANYAELSSKIENLNTINK